MLLFFQGVYQPRELKPRESPVEIPGPDVLGDEDHAEEGEDDGIWVAACVELGHDGEIHAGSKTPLGVVKQKCIVYYDFSEMDIDIGRFEGT